MYHDERLRIGASKASFSIRKAQSDVTNRFSPASTIRSKRRKTLVEEEVDDVAAGKMNPTSWIADQRIKKQKNLLEEYDNYEAIR